MSYENILVETKGRVGIIRFNRPQALNALNAALIARAQRGDRRVRGRRQHRLHPDHRLGEGVRRRRRHQGDGGQDLSSTSIMDDFGGDWDRDRALRASR